MQYKDLIDRFDLADANLCSQRVIWERPGLGQAMTVMPLKRRLYFSIEQSAPGEVHNTLLCGLTVGQDETGKAVIDKLVREDNFFLKSDELEAVLDEMIEFGGAAARPRRAAP